MKSSRWLWVTTGIVSVMATMLFAIGFVLAAQHILYPASFDTKAVAPPVETKIDPLASEKIQIVALGDSLSKGTGDISGEGYVGKVKKKLESQLKKPVFVWNFAVNGLRTQGLLDYLNNADSEVPDSIKSANIILFTIGGNDLFQFGLGNLSNTGSLDSLEIDFSTLKAKMPEAIKRMKEIITRIAELNPNATIIYLGLYHPFLDYDKNKEGSIIIQEWNHQVFTAANSYPNVTIVPTYDLFEKNLLDYLYSDHFHPNQDGYERMAERVVRALE